MMRVLPAVPSSLDEAIRVLRSGGTVVYPTETAYALGADPFNARAVRRVFALKGRGEHQPLGLIAASRQQVESVAMLHPEEEKLMERWPAALSIVFDLRLQEDAQVQKALALASAGTGTVSVRIPPHAFAHALAEKFGTPIIATSANKSGKNTCYAAHQVQKQFASGSTPDLLLDGGTLPMTLPSTVVRVEHGTVRVLRPGPVTL